MNRLLAAAIVVLCGATAAAAQRRQVVYVDVVFDRSADVLAHRAGGREIPVARDHLKDRLLVALKDTYLASWWELRQLPFDPADRPKSYYAIEVSFSVSGSEDSSKVIRANAVLKGGAVRAAPSLLAQGAWGLSEPGDFPAIAGQGWSKCYSQLADLFGKGFVDGKRGAGAAGVLVREGVPVAHGGVQALKAQEAALPLDYATFRGCGGYLLWYRAVPAGDPVVVTSQAFPGSYKASSDAPELVHVRHTKWDLDPYVPKQHDPELAKLTADAILIKPPDRNPDWDQ